MLLFPVHFIIISPDFFKDYFPCHLIIIIIIIISEPYWKKTDRGQKEAEAFEKSVDKFNFS